MVDQRVDAGVLQSIASTLRKASSDVDGLASSIPGPPDAGNGTGTIMGIVSRLAQNAGELVIGAAGAADSVDSAKNQYANNEENARNKVRSSGIRAE